MREALALLAVASAFAFGVAATPTEDRDVVTRFADPDILESSGLVVDGTLAVTVNDSGDGARVFTVDLVTGETVGTTTYDGEARDVEALAPAGPGEVWVADIGDNLEARDGVTVTRVPYGRGDQAAAGDSFDLVYPDGEARDAEALLRHPVTGRLYLVTKDLLGGTVYAAPSNLRDDAPNRLAELGPAPGLVTDGAFWADGEHLVLRNYGQAFVLAFPGLEEVGQVALPSQEQGEGLAIGPDEAVYLSSEGAEAPLLRLVLPDEVREAMVAGEEPSARPSPSADPDPGPPPTPAPPTSVGDIEVQAWKWIAGGLVGTVGLIALVLSLRPR